MVVGFTTTHAINATKVVCLNPAHGKVYLIPHYDFIWLDAGLWFSPSTPVSSTDKTDHHDINEILLKVALNTIILTTTPVSTVCFNTCFDCCRFLEVKMWLSCTHSWKYFFHWYQYLNQEVVEILV